ncbi:MAG TPA: methyltransferase [Vicinamibacterales bacterium]|jgi:protein-S-isoprenylcysteine O-methyltransferase Ste14|nr:methyltransferase [Vicinamibacterales bacterium]
MGEPRVDRPAVPGATWLLCAWLGGAAFVVSLALFLYDYFIRFATLSADAAVVPALLDTTLFTIFALHHSIFARTSVKRLVTRAVPVWFERSLFTWVASIVFIIVLVLWQPVDGVLYAVPAGWRWIAYAAQIAGILLTVRGSSAIDVLDLAGIRPVIDARRHTPPRHVPLETRGVYGLVRHPLYFGWALIVCGAPTMTGTRAVFAIVSTLYLAIAIPLEERALIHVFGDAYRTYQERTRWRMIPGLW